MKSCFGDSKTFGVYNLTCTGCSDRTPCIVRVGEQFIVKPVKEREFGRYFKACPFDGVDVYRVLLLFGVTDPCIQHAVKKLLVFGKRGTKDATQDVKEAIASLERWIEMRREEQACLIGPSQGTVGP
jgi:hypothetical protein